MEIFNQGCKFVYDLLKMYIGIKEFEFLLFWGINNCDDLIQIIYQMIDDGYVNDLVGLYLIWYCFFFEEWKVLIVGGLERGLIYI